MLVESLQQIITGDSGIQSLIGTPSTRADSANGVWPTMAPDQPAVPYVIMQQVGQSSESETFDGTGALQSARWRFSCYGSTYKQTKELAKKLRLLLIGLDGTQSGSVEIHGAWSELEADTAESLGRGTLFSTHIEMRFVYVDSYVS